MANEDLEIRGAGNLLGDEQSGHVKDIGIELYQSMLKEEVEKQKNNQTNEEQDFADFEFNAYFDDKELEPVVFGAYFKVFAITTRG